MASAWCGMLRTNFMTRLQSAFLTRLVGMKLVEKGKKSFHMLDVKTSQSSSVPASRGHGECKL